MRDVPTLRQRHEPGSKIVPASQPGSNHGARTATTSIFSGASPLRHSHLNENVFLAAHSSSLVVFPTRFSRLRSENHPSGTFELTF
jgi:hypothetical protein